MRKPILSPVRGLMAAVAALCIAVSLVAAPPARAQFGVSEKDELAAGRNADAQIRQQYHVNTNSHWNGLVKHLGVRLARVSERPDLPWTFRVLDSKEINAFSVPGYVYVTTGLLNFVGDDQDALACVIGHEIGHTTGRHAVKAAQQEEVGNLIVGLLGARAGGGVRTLLGLGANLIQLGHSRGDEYDADRRGIRYAIKAGYDPEGLIRFFDKLKAKEGDTGGIAAYFQTHPATGDRIKRAQDEIRKDEAEYGRG